MIRLYIIRHGETDWNVEKRFQGWSDIELNEKGFKQAEVLAERFKKIKIDEIYSSPLKRAVCTAEPLSKLKGIPVITNDNFKEIYFGDWEGLTVPQLYSKYGEEFQTFLKKPEEGTFPGDISFARVTDRIRVGLDEILKESNDKNIVVVSHGGIVRLMISYLMDFPGDWYNKTWIDNTSISVVEIREQGNLLRILNDFSHINQGIV